MTPEEYLNMIEGSEKMADFMDRFKESLIEKGWTVEGAEYAATSWFVTMMESTRS